MIHHLHRLFFSAWFALFLPLAGNCFAIDTPPVSAREQVIHLQNIYRKLISLSFDFSQVTRANGRDRTGNGSAVFLRPSHGLNKERSSGIMRWNYTAPDPQIILNDGKKISIYNEKDKQVIVTSSEELESDITYAFLAGTKNLLDEFEAVSPDNRFLSGTSVPLQSVRLVPREPHPQIKTVHLWFDDEALIHQVIIEDHFESLTELHFSHIDFNNISADDPGQIEKILALDLPKGTEIISQ